MSRTETAVRPKRFPKRYKGKPWLPTNTIPGTRARMLVMADRATRDVPTCHPGDRTLDDVNAADMEADRPSQSFRYSSGTRAGVVVKRRTVTRKRDSNYGKAEARGY